VVPYVARRQRPVVVPQSYIGSRGLSRTVCPAATFRGGRYREAAQIMSTLVTWLAAAVRRDEEGQGLAEYALILALIAIVVIGAVIFLGGQINTIMSNVGTSI